MSKTMIIAAAASALAIAAPAFAQEGDIPAAEESAGFGGLNGSATRLRDAPRGDEIGRTGAGSRKAGSGGATAEGIVRQSRRSGVGGPRQARNLPARQTPTNNMKQVGLANH